jgi:Zn-dependent protease with chaperone function
LADEERQAVELACQLLSCSEPSNLWVIDRPLPEAAVRGDAVLLTRPVLELEALPAILAHELGHLHSLDGRLTEALDRLSLWGDPLAPPTYDQTNPDSGCGIALESLRWGLRFAGGGTGEALLVPAWAAYWRSREYAADVHAARLGQGFDLAEHLSHFDQPLDLPRPTSLIDRSQHPPIALRTERLREVSS